MTCTVTNKCTLVLALAGDVVDVVSVSLDVISTSNQASEHLGYVEGIWCGTS